MAKKKPAKSKKAAAGRKAAKKNPRKGARVVIAKKRRLLPAPAVESSPTLGRPKVTGEEDLDLLFKEDYHARQIFKFLNVSTVKQLEQFSAAEILRRLSRPIKETVERVRRSLARQYDPGVRDPNIQVTDVDLKGNRRLVLTHRMHIARKHSCASIARSNFGLRNELVGDIVCRGFPLHPLIIHPRSASFPVRHHQSPNSGCDL
jgi:spore cortex formation protein SpoVR/YcgB (stage V sporulation)